MHFLFKIFKFIFKFVFIFFCVSCALGLIFDNPSDEVEGTLAIASLLFTFAIIYRVKLWAMIKSLFGKIKHSLSEIDAGVVRGEKFAIIKRELIIIAFCFILTCIVTSFLAKSPENILKSVLEKNQEVYAEFNARMEENKVYFYQKQSLPESQEAPDDAQTQDDPVMPEEVKGVDITGFRERIGSLGFIKDYLWACAKDVFASKNEESKRRELVRNTVYKYAGRSCEEGLKNTQQIYKDFCNKLNANLQEEIEILYGDKVNDGDLGNSAYEVVSHEDLESLFANQQTELLVSVADDTITIILAPWTAQGAITLATGAVGGPVGLAISSVGLAMDVYQFFKRSDKLDEIAGKFQVSVNLYRHNVYAKYGTLAKANFEAANEIAKKIAENTQGR